MHICIFSTRGISGHLTHWGGVQTHTINLANLLIENGHDVSIITGSGKYFKEGSLRIIPVGNNLPIRPSKKWFKQAYQGFRKIHSNHSVDCVFSVGQAVHGLISEIIKFGIPVIAFMHLLNIHYYYNTWQEVDGWRPLKSYLFRTLPRVIYDMIIMDLLFLKKCKKIITGSYTIAGQIEKYYRISRKNIEVIHNWVDTDQFLYDKITRYDIRQKFGIEEKDIAILILGALRRAKGFRIALHAFQRIRSHLPNGILIISGEGSDRTYIERYITRHQGLEKKVKLIGQYPHRKLPGLFSACDMFIIPSLMNEVLPYTLLEAMACKLPIIASDIVANREALGSSGNFFRRGDVNSLARLMTDFSYNFSTKKSEAIINRKRVKTLFSKEMALSKLNLLIDQVSTL